MFNTLLMPLRESIPRFWLPLVRPASAADSGSRQGVASGLSVLISIGSWVFVEVLKH